MWGDVLGLALVAALNPMLLAFILLVLSRRRPVQNLLSFWVGCLIVNVPFWLGTLLALHWVPSFESFARDLATPDPTSGVQPLQLGTGLFCLLLAALIATHIVVRRRTRQPAWVGAGGPSTDPDPDSDPPAAEPRPPGRIRSAFNPLVSGIGRLFGRAKEEWESGAVWVSVLFGLGYVAPPPLILLVDTIIVGSGAPIGTQILAVFAFIVVMLAVLEVALLSYAVAPGRTQAVLEPVHAWAQTHRMQILLALFVVVGIWQVATGSGLV